jgi:hypothetical protein
MLNLPVMKYFNSIAMKNIFATVFLSLILFITPKTEAQRHEVGFFVGGDYYLGDLVSSQFAGQIGPNFGLMYRYDFNRRIAARIAGHYGMLYGDSKDNKENLRYKNLSFQSMLLDIEMGIEINFLEFDPSSDKHKFTPFVFGGVSVFRFNPKAEYQGQLYELQPLGTEGQGTTAFPDKKPYRLMSWSIPFGGGVKFAISRRVNIALEYGLRKTFTDYLDDVSTRYPDVELLSAEKSPLAAVLSVRMYEDWASQQGLNIAMGANGQPLNEPDYKAYLEKIKAASGSQRGNSEDKDWYAIFGLTFTFKIVGPKKGTCPAYKKHHYFKEYLTY